MQDYAKNKKEVFPQSPIHKVNWLTYLLVVFLSIIFTILPIGFLILAAIFLNAHQAMIYVWSAIISASIGAITGLILLNVAKTRKRYLFCASISGVVSFLTITLFVQVIMNMNKKMSFMGNVQISSIIEGLVVFVFFSIPLLLLFYLKKNDLV
ncbi:MAG: hypothetical protein ACP5N2_04735 [Candidatus Nanoarchaeia archaeon]